jgi:hypothetical protein
MKTWYNDATTNFRTFRAKDPEPDTSLREWLEDWEQAVADGQSRISRAEAIRRWESEEERETR